jgi:hypothetical protein
MIGAYYFFFWRRRERFVTDPGAGQRYVDYILNSPLDRHCQVAFRMSRSAFYKLLQMVSPALRLQRARKDAVSPEEQLAIFLDYVSEGHSQQRQSLDFQHSLETIHRIRHRVMDAILRLVYPKYVKQPTAIPLLRDGDARFRRLAGAVGALDGVHIEVFVPPEDADAWRNRKGFTSHNVLAACDWNMNSTFVLAGGQGSGPDAKIFSYAKAKIKLPEGGFYLGNLLSALWWFCYSRMLWAGDAGYALTRQVLTPYRGGMTCLL